MVFMKSILFFKLNKLPLVPNVGARMYVRDFALKHNSFATVIKLIIK